MQYPPVNSHRLCQIGVIYRRFLYTQNWVIFRGLTLNLSEGSTFHFHGHCGSLIRGGGNGAHRHVSLGHCEDTHAGAVANGQRGNKKRTGQIQKCLIVGLLRIIWSKSPCVSYHHGISWVNHGKAPISTVPCH